ncbi:MAG: DUF4981 domain-containing protein [Oscillospiraceae bacterium]|nr:DUF4981 domain-containing protein [Oscillospiraceae bacterium]
MKYRIQQNTYRDFAVYEQHRRNPRAYFIPYSNEETLRGTSQRDERYNSDLVRVLSGKWGFAYYSDFRDLPRELDTTTVKFSDITVPSTWQREAGGRVEPPVYLNTRYEFDNPPPELPEAVPCGVYRKTFKLEEIENKTFLLSFLGAAGSLDVYCNGYHVGYSEGAHNTAEFDLTPVVRQGGNELICVVHKWSTGTFLECQDMFRENGIFRDVLLYTLPKVYLNDIWLRPRKQAEGYRLSCVIEVQGEQQTGWSVEFGIDGLEAKYNGSSRERMTFSLNELQVEEWSAENPVLYTAWVKLKRGSEVSQVVRVPIGFKNIEIRENVYLFNGKAVKFKGVNHHDTNAKTGWCMTYDDYLQDLQLMKSLNVNAVRTAHYPPDPHLLSIANELGLYIIDEADIEAHGCHSTHGDYDLISRDKLWIPRFLDRIKRMFFRDRNHVCVAMWSLGNEAGGHHCQDAGYAYLHACHPEIPVHYEGVWNHEGVHGYNVYSRMYPSIEEWARIGAGDESIPEKVRKLPGLLCEYTHAMGVGPGSLDDYWKVFYQHDNLMGGCIWEWADHAVEDGGFTSKAGNALRYTYGGDHGERIHDGNFCVDGLVYPDRTPHTGAWCMKNVYRTVRASFADGKLTLKNTNYFTNEVCGLAWQLLHNGVAVQEGTAQLDITPQGTQEIKLDLPQLAAGDYHLTLNYGDDLAFEQITLQEQYIAEQMQGNGDLADILATMQPNFTRAALDNDKWICCDSEDEFDMLVSTEELANGATRVTAKLIPDKMITEQLQITRFGVTLQLPRSWDNVKYYGLGERENLSDFTDQSKMGVFETTVAVMHEPYIFPQDNGNHGQVRWLQLTDENGKGLRVANAPGRLNFSAQHYSQASLTAATHQEDLRDEGLVYLNIDGFVRGTGSASCGPDVLEEYRIDLSDGLEFAFEIAAL